MSRLEKLKNLAQELTQIKTAGEARVRSMKETVKGYRKERPSLNFQKIDHLIDIDEQSNMEVNEMLKDVQRMIGKAKTV